MTSNPNPNPKRLMFNNLGSLTAVDLAHPNPNSEPNPIPNPSNISRYALRLDRYFKLPGWELL